LIHIAGGASAQQRTGRNATRAATPPSSLSSRTLAVDRHVALRRCPRAGASSFLLFSPHVRATPRVSTGLRAAPPGLVADDARATRDSTAPATSPLEWSGHSQVDATGPALKFVSTRRFFFTGRLCCPRSQTRTWHLRMLEEPRRRPLDGAPQPWPSRKDACVACAPLPAARPKKNDPQNHPPQIPHSFRSRRALPTCGDFLKRAGFLRWRVRITDTLRRGLFQSSVLCPCVDVAVYTEVRARLDPIPLRPYAVSCTV